MGSFVSITRTSAEQQGNQAVVRDAEQMAEDNLKSLLGVSSKQLRFTNAGYQIIR